MTGMTVQLFAMNLIISLSHILLPQVPSHVRPESSQAMPSVATRRVHAWVGQPLGESWVLGGSWMTLAEHWQSLN